MVLAFMQCEVTGAVEGADQGGEPPLLILDPRRARCACRKLRPCWSGGVVVLVEDAAQSLSSVDVQVDDLGLVGDRWWQRLQWSGVGDALVRSVRVVELLVLPQSVE